jgi:hypothetical protein
VAELGSGASRGKTNKVFFVMTVLIINNIKYIIYVQID